VAGQHNEDSGNDAKSGITRRQTQESMAWKIHAMPPSFTKIFQIPCL
jgi:hypothetical protein